MKLIPVFAALCAAVPSLAQSFDASFWTRSTAGTTTPIPWVTGTAKGVFLDGRWAFDAPKTGGAYVGKTFTLWEKSITLIPEGGALFGKETGFGPELLALTSHGKWSTFSQWQYVKGIRGSDSFAYGWAHLLREVFPGVKLGADAQSFYIRGGHQPQTDVGPCVQFETHGMYFRAWSAWSVGALNRGNPTLFVGIGYAR